MNKIPDCKLDFIREDDYVEYFLFPKLPESVSEPDPDMKALNHYLNTILDSCRTVIEKYVNALNYIWHKDEFQLRARNISPQERLLDDETKTDSVPLPPHLHGVTHYGDNITDEWFIVFLLCKLTQEVPDCIARVIDADGEFLLIEAAELLPKWANPDTCEQRVYLVNGGLQLVQNSPSNTTKLMPVVTALAKIRQNPTLYRASQEIQNCINERLKEFHENNINLHYQIVNLPLGVAAILKRRPNLIAAAVRAFCERDSIDLKACRSMRYFPPEQRIRARICFTRCLYAMLMHNNYIPDRRIGWNLPVANNTEQYKEDLLGVKIACGFEILASQGKETDDTDSSPAWRAYVRSLTAKGYFRDNLEGSQEYQQLLKEAQTFFKSNNERFQTAPLVGSEILQILRSINVEHLRTGEETELQPSDSDDWLNISAEQLDAMLAERYGPRKLYKSNGDINAEEFTKNIAEFLEKQSGLEGISNDDDDEEDDDVDEHDSSSDEGAKSKSSKNGRSTSKMNGMKSDGQKINVRKSLSMRKACEQNSLIDHKSDTSTSTNATNATNATNSTSQSSKTTVPPAQNPQIDDLNIHVRNFLDFVIPEDNWDSNSDMSDYGDEEDLDKNMEDITKVEASMDADIKEYMKQMDSELAGTTIGQTFVKRLKNAAAAAAAGGGNAVLDSDDDDDDFNDIETFEPIDINVNTLKNMLDSYKTQAGGVGPVTNLLSAMGAGMALSAAEGQPDEQSSSKQESKNKNIG